MTETSDLTRGKKISQARASEDAIVEIAGGTGESKKWGKYLDIATSFDPENATDEQKKAVERLNQEFGKFTSLVIETWNAPGNVAKRAKAIHS